MPALYPTSNYITFVH